MYFERGKSPKQTMRIGVIANSKVIESISGGLGKNYPSPKNIHETLKAYEDGKPLTWTKTTRDLFEHRWKFRIKDVPDLYFTLTVLSGQFLEYQGKFYEIPRL